MPGATDMLREDHRKVKELFRKFEQTENTNERKAIVESALTELDIHARLEEEIFYPAVRSEVREEETEELMNEAEEEHHVVDVLAREIMKLQPDDPEYAAKFTVLYENVEHHIEEEESEMLPKADELGPERMEELGMRMQERKQALMTSGNGHGSSTRSRSTSTRSRSARRTKAGQPARSRSGSASGSGKSKSRSK
jgi:hemerythrin superfamily protein